MQAQDQITSRVAALEATLLSLTRVEFGDLPGHDFHGNQYTAVGDFGGEKRTTDEEAARLRDKLIEGKKVLLHEPGHAAILVDKLAAYARECKAQGKDAPNFNLCNITVPGTNLFCEGNLGIPRDKMPQMSGTPIPGSPAAQFHTNAKGEVDGSGAFVREMRSQGIGVKDGEMRATELKATQNELIGPKVAGMMNKIADGKMDPGSIFVTRDGYVIDGHHRYAAMVGMELTHPDQADSYKLPVRIVDANIEDVLPKAIQWAEQFGIRAKEGK